MTKAMVLEVPAEIADSEAFKRDLAALVEVHARLAGSMPTQPMGELLNGTELMQRLGISRSKFHRERARGTFKVFEVKRPFGQRKYSRTLIDAFVSGESPSRLGKRL